jgi:hypothetical protein
VLDALTGTLATQAASSVAITGGTITGLTSLTLASGAATPATNDAAALGTTALQWSDLFLANGGVINFDNGDVTITEGTNTLAFAGASSGYSYDAALLPSTNDAAALGVSGTAWADLFLASGGVINFNAGNYTLTHSAGVLTANGALSIGTGNALTAGTIELGAATDTTLSRGAAGFIAVEGNRVPSPASQASGDILYRGATEWERLAKGTASQVLTMNSGATAPEWAAAPAAGGLTLIGTITTTSLTAQALTSIPGTYKGLRLIVKGVSCNGSFALTLELSSTNGAAYGALRTITNPVFVAAARSFWGVVDINVYTAAVTGKVAQIALVQDNGSAGGGPAVDPILTNTAAACNAIRVGGGGATFDAGTIEVYGVS